jgi:hypothetical protein
MEWFYGYSLFLIQFLFELWLYNSCTYSLQDMVLYKALIISREFRMFQITLGLQPYNHKKFDYCYCFIFSGLTFIISFLFSLFDPSFLWKQNCVSYPCQIQVGMVLPTLLYEIGASNSLATRQFFKGSNHEDYLLVLLDFNSYFPRQMIWACHWQLTSAQWLNLLMDGMLWLVVGLASIPWWFFLTYLFELRLESTCKLICNNNQLMSGETFPRCYETNPE